MRLTTLILVISIMHLSAGGFAQRITLSTKHAKLQQVFKEIRKQSGYGIICEKALLEKAKPVTLSLKEATLEEALKSCFLGQPLSYRIENKIILVSEKIEQDKSTMVIPAGMNIDIRGKVLDENSLPLQGATVKVKGSNLGVMTDKEGDFFLKGVPEDAVLVIAYLGYKTLELKAAPNMGLIRLEQNPEELQEVVINKGYYETTRELNTGSVSRVDAKVIGQQPVTNPLAALSGRMTGVQIQQTSGVPGSPFKIEIRGRNSLREEGNEPLYVIDGVPFSSQTLSASTNTVGIINGGISPLTSINSADIESIEVLKDADATAIYGSRGANGVVLISTKKGKAGKTKFDVNYYSGFSKVNLVKQLNTQQYLAMRREAFALEGLTPSANPDDNGTANSNFRAYAPDLMVWDTTRYTDWQKFFVGNTANTTSLQSSISGGSEQTQFLAGAGYFKESSVFPGEFSYRKVSSHLALNHRSLNNRFVFSASVNGSADLNDQPQEDYSSGSRIIAPNAPRLYNEDGGLNWENSTWRNPIAASERIYAAKVNYLVSSTTLGYEFAPGLKLHLKGGITRSESEENSILPSTSFDPALGYGSEQSTVSTSSGRRRSWIFEPQLKWDREVLKGKLNMLLGGTYQEEDYQLIAMRYNGFPSNSLLQDVSTAAIRSVWNYDKFLYKYAAVFTRVSYNWDRKYSVNLTGRRDGSSRFGPDKQFANFGAMGLAWVFSNEAWLMKKLPFLSFGKLRGSFGITGSDQIGNYQYLDTYAAAANTINSYNGVTALVPTRLFNPVFGWESNQKLEAALELGFLNDKIMMTTAYYRNRSGNQLVNYNLPSMTGFGGILSNLPATVQNKGMEVELVTKNIQRKNFSWTSSLNLSIPRNKLIAFPNIDSSSYANRYIVGKPIYIQKFYEYTGIDSQMGLYTVRDVDNDGKISWPNDEASARFIGQDFLCGISNTFILKSWTLDVFCQLVKQTGRLTTLAPGLQNLNVPAYFLRQNRWRKPGDQADVQRYSTEYTQGFGADFNNSSYQHFLDSDGIITDASFIRLKTVSLNYELPAVKTKGIHCSMFVRGQNLFVLTKYEGSDPETQSGSALPPLRIFTIGLNVTL